MRSIEMIRAREYALRWALNMFATAHACAFVLFGFTLLVGGAARFSSPAFTYARDLAGLLGSEPEEAYQLWGWAILLVGGLTLFAICTHRIRLRVASFVLGAFWYGFFSLGLYLSVTNVACDPSSAPCLAITGVPTYATLSALCAAHAGVSLVFGRRLG